VKTLFEIARMWYLGFDWSEARWRVRVHGQTASAMRRELHRLASRQ
jgi:hypothetical protein